jgi:CheY-like chemotaxis protein
LLNPLISLRSLFGTLLAPPLGKYSSKEAPKYARISTFFGFRLVGCEPFWPGLTSMADTVLIVEPADLLRRRLTELLRPEGYRLLEACDIAEGEGFLQREKIRVAILDLVELKHDGVSLLKWIKRWYPETQVVLLNSVQSLSLSMEAMNSGAFDEVMVPFDRKLLLDRVREASMA